MKGRVTELSELSHKVTVKVNNNYKFFQTGRFKTYIF